MIEPLYAVNFLKGHLQRFIKYKRINASIDCGDNYISFYAKDSIENKQYLARGSDHHLRMQHLANKDEPWKGDNISIVFITPDSPQDSVVRATVQQNHYGGIKPFDVTIYQYDNTLLNERDLVQIFRAIISFLSGNGYNDPFKGTPKRAKPKQRTSNIKPYKESPKKSRNISVDKDGNYDSANAWGADYISESKDIYNYKTINSNKNMNRNRKNVVRLTESKLKSLIAETVRDVLFKHPRKRHSINEADMSRYPRYRGIPGTEFIYGGDMSDNIVVYKRHKIYADDIEESLWIAYKDYGYEEAGQEEPTEQGFDEWIENQDKRWIKSQLDDLVWALDGCP